jgi:hypothetical protein
MNSPPFQISIRKGLEVQDDSLAMRTIRDLHELEGARDLGILAGKAGFRSRLPLQHNLVARE